MAFTLPSRKKYDIAIGIDPGTKTGFAIWSIADQKFTMISTLPIHKALMEMLALANDYAIIVRIEDPNKRTILKGENAMEKAQGAGSIKRDFAIWEDFLTELNIDFEKLHPKHIMTKLSPQKFEAITGWKKNYQ